jgi:TonB family protein
MRKHPGTLILLMVVASVMGCTTSKKVMAPAVPKPAALAEQKTQGQMKLRIQVAEDGTPTAVKIEQSSGFTALDQEAAASIQKNWRWPPGKVRSYTVPMKFKLQ